MNLYSATYSVHLRDHQPSP